MIVSVTPSWMKFWSTVPSVVVFVGKVKMIQLLHGQRAMSDRFIAHLLSRIVRLEESVIARR
jgi:hypothetical protein